MEEVKKKEKEEEERGQKEICNNVHSSAIIN